MLTQNWGMVATPLRSPVMWPQLYLQLGDGAPEGVRKSGLGRVHRAVYRSVHTEARIIRGTANSPSLYFVGFVAYTDYENVIMKVMSNQTHK